MPPEVLDAFKGVRGPPEENTLVFPERLYASGGLFCPWRTVCPSGGFQVARPYMAPSFLLLSRDSNLRGHSSIICPSQDAFIAGTVGRSNPEKMKVAIL